MHIEAAELMFACPTVPHAYKDRPDLPGNVERNKVLNIANGWDLRAWDAGDTSYQLLLLSVWGYVDPCVRVTESRSNAMIEHAAVLQGKGSPGMSYSDRLEAARRAKREWTQRAFTASVSQNILDQICREFVEEIAWSTERMYKALGVEKETIDSTLEFMAASEIFEQEGG